MRLLNTKTLQIEEFAEHRPSYAILSNKWGPGEVSSKDYHKPHDGIRTLNGYQKIYDLCKLARRRGLDWVWIDTCCIDKRDNSELSEAINSMFDWYQQARECYVYLHDYFPGGSCDLANCDWFTRGWTLQELLAPHSTIFCAADWTFIGRKGSRRIKTTDCRHASYDVPLIHSQLSDITGIRECYFELRNLYLPKASVAERMSWVSKRKTTRIEDIAYCMLGIFGINMPLLYGEGLRAFQRLQQEIIKVNNDTSILAWDVSAFSRMSHSVGPAEQTYVIAKTTFSSVLAPHPSYFQGCADITSGRLKTMEPYSFSNEGFQICADSHSCCLEGVSFVPGEQLFAIDLGCKRPHHDGRKPDKETPLFLFLAVQVDKNPEDNVTRRAWMALRSLPRRASWVYNKKKHFSVLQDLAPPSVQITILDLDSYGLQGLTAEIALAKQDAIPRVKEMIPGTQEHRHAFNVSFEQYSAKADIEEDTHECSCCKRCIAERYLYDLEKAKGEIRLVDNTEKVGRDCDRDTQSATGI